MGFTSYVENSGTALPTPGGLVVTYPPGGDSVAAWRKPYKRPNESTNATLVLNANVKLPPMSLPSNWYAGLGTLINGPSGDVDSVSSVDLVLGDSSSSSARISIDTFPDGTSKDPDSTTPLGSISGTVMSSAPPHCCAGRERDDGFWSRLVCVKRQP